MATSPSALDERVELGGDVLVLIFELDHSGHRLHYVRMIADAHLERRNDVVVVLSESAVVSDEFGVYLSDIESLIEVIKVRDLRRRSSFLTGCEKLMKLAAVIKEHKPTRVYVPYGDGLLQVASFFGYQSWPIIRHVPHEIVIMRGNYAYPSEGSFVSRTKMKLNEWLIGYSRWDWVHFLDPLVYEYLKEKKYPVMRRASLLPEPLEPVSLPVDRGALCLELKLNPELRYIVTAGVHDLRKGTDLLIQAFVDGGFPDDVRLLVAGKLNADIIRTIDELKGGSTDRIIVWDRYLKKDEFLNVLDVADVVATPYRKHQGSSGIISRAIIRNKPVVGSFYGWVGWVLARYCRGISSGSEKNDLIVGLRKALLFESGSESSFVREFRLLNSEGSFRESVCANVMKSCEDGFGKK